MCVFLSSRWVYISFQIHFDTECLVARFVLCNFVTISDSCYSQVQNCRLDFCSRSISRKGGGKRSLCKAKQYLTISKISSTGRIFGRYYHDQDQDYIVLVSFASPGLTLSEAPQVQRCSTLGWVSSCEPWLPPWKGASRKLQLCRTCG